MAKQTKPTKISANLHRQINVMSAQSQIPIQDILDIFCQLGLHIVNQAKEQGVQDNDIADFIDSFLEHPMTDDHINFIAQNYKESKKD